MEKVQIISEAQWSTLDTLKKIKSPVKNLMEPTKTSPECTICGRPSKGGDHYKCQYDESGIDYAGL